MTTAPTQDNTLEARARRSQRKSRMTQEAMRELDRRFNAGDDISVPFSLTTGKAIAQAIRDNKEGA